MNDQGDGWDRYKEHVLSDLSELKSDMKVIKDNHLFHMNSSILKLENNMKIFAGVITILVPAVTAIIIKFIK